MVQVRGVAQNLNMSERHQYHFQRRPFGMKTWMEKNPPKKQLNHNLGMVVLPHGYTLSKRYPKKTNTAFRRQGKASGRNWQQVGNLIPKTQPRWPKNQRQAGMANSWQFTGFVFLPNSYAYEYIYIFIRSD